MQDHKNARGFTLLEMTLAISILATGMVYLFSSFANVTSASQSAAVEADLGGQSKKALTRLFNELQGTSTVLQDTDGVDSTPPEAVFNVAVDSAAPAPFSAARSVSRTSGDPETKDGVLQLGAGKEQAREKTITTQTRLRFRTVRGYVFKESTGAVIPEWGGWITYQVDARRRLVRATSSGRTTVLALHVDAFEVAIQADNSIVATLVVARRSPGGRGLVRYANSVSILPKN